MDDYDLKILRLLHNNARMTMKEISEQVHLSQPTCTERVRRLESKGVIRQYTTIIDWDSLGYSLPTLIRIRPFPGYLDKVEKSIKEIRNIAWCAKVTGEDCFICMLITPSVKELDINLAEIYQVAMTSTSIIKATIVENKFINE